MADSSSPTSFPWRFALIGAVGVYWLSLWNVLRIDWATNNQYAFGWSVPVIAVCLFLQRWSRRPKSATFPDWQRRFLGGLLVAVALLEFPLRWIGEANAEWRILFWCREFQCVALTLGVIALAGGWRWVRHFAFPVLFTATAVPWSRFIEEPLLQKMMRLVAGLSVEGLFLVNIPALQKGNLIQLAHGIVGVGEACSGMRSVQTSLMLALVGGEYWNLTVRRRCLVVFLAVLSAFLLNLARTLSLSVIAGVGGFATMQRWHDPIGLFEMSLCLVAVMAIAWRLGGKVASDSFPTPGRDGSPSRPTSRAEQQRRRLVLGATINLQNRPAFPSGTFWQNVPTPVGTASSLSQTSHDSCAFGVHSLDAEDGVPTKEATDGVPVPTWLRFCLAGIWVASVISTQAWYKSHEIKIEPQWTIGLPSPASAVFTHFERLKAPEDQRAQLRTNDCLAFSWRSGNGRSWSLSFFRWPAGRSSEAMVTVHRPEFCLPAAGYDYVRENAPVEVAVNGVPMLFHHYLFELEKKPVHVFYLLSDLKTAGVKTLEIDLSAGARIRAAMAGQRNNRRAILELVVAGLETDAEAVGSLADVLREVVHPLPASGAAARNPSLQQGDASDPSL